MIHHCRLTSTAFLHQVGAKVNSSADLADPADPADQANQVSLSAARSLPSTRAGGQDDVSFNKLPQMRYVHARSHDPNSCVCTTHEAMKIMILVYARHIKSGYL